MKFLVMIKTCLPSSNSYGLTGIDNFLISDKSVSLKFHSIFTALFMFKFSSITKASSNVLIKELREPIDLKSLISLKSCNIM